MADTFDEQLQQQREISERKSRPWLYSDEQALFAKSVLALTQRMAALEKALAEVQAAQVRQAEYQGVKHLLTPQ